MLETAPFPVLRKLAQPALDRIAVNIAQLLNKLRIIANVEIVVPLLPEMLRVPKQAPGHSLLEGFEGIGERVLLRSGGPFKPDFGLSGGCSDVTDDEPADKLDCPHALGAETFSRERSKSFRHILLLPPPSLA